MTTLAACFMDESYRLIDEPAREQSENDIVGRALEGDASAFREIYLTYRSQVYKIAARMVLNEADREEVTQDTFLQIFRSLKNFQGISSLSTWIHRVTINVALQHIRRKKSRVSLQLGHPQTEVAEVQLDSSRHKTPEEGTLQAEQRAAVERGLARLSPKKRAVLILYDFEGLSAKEVSKIVNASVLTVRTRLFYARRELYQYLSREPSCVDIGIEEDQ